MTDNDRAGQPDPGRRFRRPRRWRTWGRRRGGLRTVRGRGSVVGAGWFDPLITNFMGDTAWLFGQAVPVTSLGNAVMDVSGCMLPAWPSAPACRGKASRLCTRRRRRVRAGVGSRAPRVLAADGPTQLVPAARLGTTLTLCQVRPIPRAATRPMEMARRAPSGSTTRRWLCRAPAG